MKPQQDTGSSIDSFEPMTRILTPEFARPLVSLRADPIVQDKIDSLAGRCNEGLLTPEETQSMRRT